MHACLRTPELLSNIFEYVWLNSGWGARKDLASLARTCKDFHYPAVSILWRTIDSLYHIISCLPDDAYEVKSLAQDFGCFSFLLNLNPHGSLRLSRQLCLDDLKRLELHASRVKSLVHTAARGLPATPDIEVACLACIASLRGAENPLFCNVKNLTVDASQFLDPLASRLWTMKVLQKLTVRAGLWEAGNIAIWKNISSVFGESGASIKEFVLVTSDDPSDGGSEDEDNTTAPLDGIQPFFPSLTNLNHLALCFANLDPSIFRAISVLPNLSSLSIHAGVYTPSNFDGPGPYFPALRKLTVEIHDLNPGMKYVNHFKSVALTSFTIVGSRDPHLGWFTSILTGLEPGRWDQCLQHIRVWHRLWVGRRCFAGVDILEPLRRFEILKELHLEPICLRAGDKTFFSSLASTLPRLTSLSLMQGIEVCNLVHVTGPEEVTLAELLSGLPDAPALEKVGLTVNAWTLPLSSETDSLPQSQIASLHVNYSPVHETQLDRVVSLLRRCLPNLKTLEAGPSTLHEASRLATWAHISIKLFGGV